MSHVVTVNAGSSSTKFALFDVASGQPAPVAIGQATSGAERTIRMRDAAGQVIHEEAWRDGADFHADALRRLLAWRCAAFPMAQVVGVGHRVVHGGLRFVAPALVTDAVLADLRSLVPLAPLHEPHNIAGIEAARAAWPDVGQVACFDTAFHRAHPFVNDTYALPRALHDEGVRRYGFHGLSYEFVAGQLAEIAPARAAGRVVIAHLGNGASMCALRDGRSVASTMGFTALDGLAMGTRCGQIDPGVILYLLQEKHMDAAAIARLLYEGSGLLGMSGVSSDMRELLASRAPDAARAVDYFVARIRYELGGLAATLGGLDAVVFTGGIGENAWQIRERVLADMQWLGLDLDAAANRAGAATISAAASRVLAFVVPTNEEMMIARHTVSVICGAGQAKNPHPGPLPEGEGAAPSPSGRGPG